MPISPISKAVLFWNSNFENTYHSSILFFISTGSTGAPVKSQRHLLFTMADNPLSIALPPSPPTAACSTDTCFKDVPNNKKTTEIGQKWLNSCLMLIPLIRTILLLVSTVIPLPLCYLQKACMTLASRMLHYSNWQQWMDWNWLLLDRCWSHQSIWYYLVFSVIGKSSMPLSFGHATISGIVDQTLFEWAAETR